MAELWMLSHALENRDAVRRPEIARVRSGSDAHNQAGEDAILVGVLPLAAAVAYKVGLWAEKQKTTAVKAHGRKEKSVIRRGLETLARLLAGSENKTQRILSPPAARQQSGLLILLRVRK